MGLFTVYVHCVQKSVQAPRFQTRDKHVIMSSASSNGGQTLMNFFVFLFILFFFLILLFHLLIFFLIRKGRFFGRMFITEDTTGSHSIPRLFTPLNVTVTRCDVL